MDDRDTRFEDDRYVGSPGFQFLMTELQVGNTFVDIADNSRHQDATARRLQRAWEAHDEVARRLAHDRHLRLSASERRRIADGLEHLRQRLEGRE